MAINIGDKQVIDVAVRNRYALQAWLGDQLLWGAAEPLRRMLHILLGAQSGANVRSGQRAHVSA